MIEQDRKRFKEIMVGIGDLYDKEITKSKLSLYFEMLTDLTVEQFESGVKAHCRETGKEGSFFPKPADIIRQVEKGSNKRHGLSHEEILAAWRMKNTVFGILCRTVITSFDMENMSDSGLKQKTAQIKMLINDWEQRADKLDYTQHEKQLLIKYDVVPNRGLFNDKKLDVDATSLKLEYQADRDKKKAEQPEQEKKVNIKAQEEIREMLRGL
ncbi:bacteriophage protein [uncultured Mediterranean phage uvMED]|nr:bacteriophage protein [uncultured Mediterranean phage uvMED]